MEASPHTTRRLLELIARGGKRGYSTAQIARAWGTSGGSLAGIGAVLGTLHRRKLLQRGGDRRQRMWRCSPLAEAYLQDSENQGWTDFDSSPHPHLLGGERRGTQDSDGRSGHSRSLPLTPDDLRRIEASRNVPLPPGAPDYDRDELAAEEAEEVDDADDELDDDGMDDTDDENEEEEGPE